MTFHGLMVIDFHSHFPTQAPWGSSPWRQRLVEKYGEDRTDILMRQQRQYRDEWRRRWGFEPPEAEAHTDEEQASRWVADMDRKGVDKVNFVTGGGNDNLAKIVGGHSARFTGFAHNDPFDEDAPAELEHAVKDLGLRGYKLIASSQTRPIDDESLYPLWEMAERLRVPVLIHFGVLGGGGGPALVHRNMDPLTLEEVAKMFPELSFVIPHFGAGYLRELLLLCWSCPNIFIDTSGSNQWMTWMPFELDLKGVFRKAIETVGPDRIVFGTDSSYFPRGFSVQYLEEQLRMCRSIGLDEGSVEKIFYRNASRLLKLDE